MSAFLMGIFVAAHRLFQSLVSASFFTILGALPMMFLGLSSQNSTWDAPGSYFIVFHPYSVVGDYFLVSPSHSVSRPVRVKRDIPVAPQHSCKVAFHSFFPLL